MEKRKATTSEVAAKKQTSKKLPPIAAGPVSVKRDTITLPEHSFTKEYLLAALARATGADKEHIKRLAAGIGKHDEEIIHRGRLTAWADFAAWLGGDEKALD